MAKVGLEVEGKFRDDELRTLFISADEYLDPNFKLLYVMMDNLVEHVYISDHHNVIDLDELAYRFACLGVMVTVELTELTEQPPDGVEIFWNVSQASYAQSRTINFLREGDQVKVENEKTVLSWEVREAVVTLPEDFEGDITV